jgi:hypothetical protein
VCLWLDDDEASDRKGQHDVDEVEGSPLFATLPRGRGTKLRYPASCRGCQSGWGLVGLYGSICHLSTGEEGR